MAASVSSIPFSEHAAPTLSAIQGSPQIAIAVTALLVGSGLFWIQSSTGAKSAGFPKLANQTAEEFQANALEIIEKGRAQFKDKPFTIITQDGELTMVSPEIGNALRSEPALSLSHAITDQMHPHLPGFELFAPEKRPQTLLQIVARKQLPKSISRVIKPLSVEASFAVEHNFGSSTDWRTVQPYPEFLDIIARLSSLVFLGQELCRNDEWLNITKSYTVTSIQAAQELYRYPVWMRRFANAWLLPKGRVIRQQVADATRLIDRVIEERRRDRQQRGGKAADNEVPNSIDWFEEENAGKPYNTGQVQILLSTVAIQTTTDLLTETMLRLVQEPEFVEELRAEIKSVLLAENAWTKTALYKLKMVDSAFKEAQRMRPLMSAATLRKVMKPTPIPGTGRTLPKGALLAVSAHLRLDPDVYEQPHKYNGRRFADMRASGETNLPVQLVSTGPTSLSFGHGLHACPGRFFAANELKIAMCHLLIKYDWELDPAHSASGSPVDMTPAMDGINFAANPSIKLRFRKRTPEEMGIDLDAVGEGAE